MSFAYAERTLKFIDVSGATIRDRVRVNLEDGRWVYLVTQDGHGQNLSIDQELTHYGVTDELWNQVIERAKSGGSRSYNEYAFWCFRFVRKVKRPNFEPLRDGAKFTVWVDATSDAFDHSPLVGEKLQVFVSVPGGECGGAKIDSPITAVDFVQV